MDKKSETDYVIYDIAYIADVKYKYDDKNFLDRLQHLINKMDSKNPATKKLLKIKQTIIERAVSELS